MVLRSGAKLGPARKWDWAGAAAGVALVLILLIFVAWAGTRDGYSHVDDTISQLGGRGTPGARWFTAVNLVGAVLIIVFAYAVHRRLAVGLATGAFLGAAALGGVLIGIFRCSGECLPGTRDAHDYAASFTALMITAVLFSAFFALPKRTGWFKWVTLACAIVNAAFLLSLALRATDSDWVGLRERLVWASAYVWVLIASLAIIRPPRLHPKPLPFDPALVQRKLLRSSAACTYSAYAFFSIRDADGAKHWLRAAIDPAARAVLPDDGSSPRSSVTLAFTCAGLRVFDVKYSNDDAFAEGMKARAERLGDVGESSPQHWQDAWRGEDLHLLVWVEAEDAATRDSLLERVLNLDRRGALHRVSTQFATSIRRDGNPVDHRGFRDGISQPWVLLKGSGRNDPERQAGGTREFGEWRPLAVGEFVLGELDESDDVSPVPQPTEIFRHGSFLVVRKLAQDLSGIETFMEAEEMRLGVPDLEERLLGRRRDGRRLNLDPNQPLPKADELNDFTFGSDADGLECPLGAHIRRANPRDALGFGLQLSERHRIIRRGNTYSADHDAPSGLRKGLVFIAVNARIEDQFEFIQRLWLNDGDRQRLGASRDLIAGSSESASTAMVQIAGRTLVTTVHRVLIRTMGGEYFFAPSMAGLEALANWPSTAR